MARTAAEQMHSSREVALRETERVVYIASVGYSGSTLLELLLGAHEEVVSLGEVYLLASYARSEARCTCGTPVRICPFWMSVQEEVRVATKDPTFVLGEHPLTVEERTQTLFRRIPSITDVALVLGSQAVWRLVKRLDSRAREYGECAENLLKVLNASSKVSGKPIVVDSSKFAVPMKVLFMAIEDKLRVVYLVRDGRATVLSLMKRHSMSFERATHYWKRYNWNLQLMMRSLPSFQVMLINYERLCEEPHAELRKICTFIGCAKPVKSLELIKQQSHSIGGNPMRFRLGEVTIARDDKWQSLISKSQLGLFDSIAGKMNRLLGYD